MRNAFFLLALGFAVLAVPMVAMADHVRPNKASQRSVAAGDTARRTAKKPSSVQANPCVQYGAGFFASPGSTTCVKIGGSISAGVGFSR